MILTHIFMMIWPYSGVCNNEPTIGKTYCTYPKGKGRGTLGVCTNTAVPGSVFCVVSLDTM